LTILGVLVLDLLAVFEIWVKSIKPVRVFQKSILCIFDRFWQGHFKGGFCSFVNFVDFWSFLALFDPFFDLFFDTFCGFLQRRHLFWVIFDT
jgi:hypothetical protein